MRCWGVDMVACDVNKKDGAYYHAPKGKGLPEELLFSGSL